VSTKTAMINVGSITGVRGVAGHAADGGSGA
jgi:hypothetical protein